MSRLLTAVLPCCWRCVGIGLWAALAIVATFALLTAAAL